MNNQKPRGRSWLSSLAHWLGMHAGRTCLHEFRDAETLEVLHVNEHCSRCEPDEFGCATGEWGSCTVCGCRIRDDDARSIDDLLANNGRCGPACPGWEGATAVVKKQEYS